MVIPRVIEVIQQVQEWEGGVSDFISGPTPANPLAAAAQASYRKSCERYSASPGFLQGLGVTGRTIGRICKPYLDGQGYSLPEETAPFQGGQCRGTLYRLTAVATNQLGTNFNISGQGYGPIELVVGVRDGNTGFVDIIANSQPTDGGTNFRSAVGGVAGSGNRFTVSNVVLTVLSGPDNCGNPPTEFKPGPTPAPDPGPSFEPTLDPDSPNFPRFPDPTEYTDPVGGPLPFPEIDIDIGLGGGSGDGGGDIPTGPGTAGGPEDTGPGGEASGEAGPGEVLIGVKVDILDTPAKPRLVENTGLPYYIGAAYVSMGWDGQLDLDNSGQFMRSGDFFTAPLGSTHWTVQAAVGYNLRATPYYETIEEPQEV